MGQVRVLLVMPSTTEIDRPEEALSVVKQYLKRERPLSALVIVVLVSLFIGTYFLASPLLGILVAVILLVVARAPILQSRGTVRLRSDNDPETVANEFTGPTPPVLAFQWGVADEVTIDDETTTYHVSYFFGLRSTEMAVKTQTTTTPAGEHQVELDVTANGRPWATYTVTINHDGDWTIVDVEYTSNRRFGLRRLPQQLMTERYRGKALTAQGYTVVDRDAHFGF